MAPLQKLGIGQKLLFGFLAVSLLVALVGFFGFRASRQIVELFKGGEEHFRQIVSAGTEVNSYVKDAESHLILFLTLSDPADRVAFEKSSEDLLGRLLILDRTVGIPEARKMFEQLQMRTNDFLATAKTLLEQHDEDFRNTGRFDLLKHRELVRTLNRNSSAVREQGLKLTKYETDFLNRQEAITAGTEVTSYAKRAEGHLMLFLALGDAEDRQKFYERIKSLKEQLAILDERMQSPEGKSLVEQIKKRAAEVDSLGCSLIGVYDGEGAGITRRFAFDRHRELLREFARAAHEIGQKGITLSELNVSLEIGQKEAVVKRVSGLQHVILLVIVCAFLLSLALGYASSQMISKPLVKLRDAAREVGKGNFDTKIDSASGDEVGQLADSFNTMVGDLRNSRVELIAAKDYLDSIIKSMMDSLIVITPEGTIQTVNAATCTMLGYEERELVGKPVEKIFPEDASLKGSALADLIRECAIRNEERTYVSKDGRRIPVIFSGAVMGCPEGDMLGIVCVAQDITERKLAEEALRKSEEQFRLTFEYAPIGVAVAGTDGRLLRVNQALCNALGYTTEELLTLTFGDITYPDDLAANLYMIERLLRGEMTHHQMETRYIKKDGGIVIAILNVALVRNVQGFPLHLIAQVLDITDRRRAREALERSNRQNQLLLDAVGEGIYGVDPDGKASFINPAALEMVGYEAEELVGKPIHDIIHRLRKDGTHYPFEDCPIKVALSEGTVSHVADEVFCRKDGTAFPVEYVSTPIREQGAIVGAVVVFIDITERKRMEEELVKARKLESVGILASGIAHDFNNLLTGILNCLSLAKSSIGSGDSVFETLTMAEEASREAKSLTQQLFTFAKMGDLLKETTTLGQLIRDAALFSLSRSKVTCEFSLADDLWPVEADVGQISRVMHNLVINARDAMPEGGVVRIRAENAPVSAKNGMPLKEGNYVRISIEDHGHGIPERHIEKIFDPYFTTKQKGSQKGMGLGLAICYSIVKNHDGLIMVESQVGVGTTFHVYLPASLKEAMTVTDERLRL